MDIIQEVSCRQVTAVDDLLLDQVERTYNDSFPEAERRAFPLVRALLRDEERFMMYLLLREDAYAGFITAWEFDGFIYVEHFAIDESARNGGIGGKGMKAFLAIHGMPVVLEVEMPDEEMSKRRVGFYERLGFVLNPQVYFQPPYRQGEEWLEMRLMAYGYEDLSEVFDRVKSQIHRYVYGVTLSSV